jgi:putative flippase GtrA
LSPRVARFVAVGTLAACVHLSMVAILFHAGLHPLIANVFAFATAFGVSYSGHRFVTFPGGRLSHLASLHRFWWVALTSFILNEGLYALLLGSGWLNYLFSLILVLLIVTPITFVFSRFWAFR